VTRDEVWQETKELPPGLFAHNIQTRVTQTVHAQESAAKGVIGRIADSLTAAGYSTGSFSVNTKSQVLEGEPGQSPTPDVVNIWGGTVTFDETGLIPELSETIMDLVRNTSRSFVAETWAGSMSYAVERAEVLSDALANHGSLQQPFAADESYLGRQLELVANLISARTVLDPDRNMFFVEIGGFDTHSNMKSDMAAGMEQTNAALQSFKEEMELQGLWEDVVIVGASEFARTLTSNGLGTDHGWGGNMFVAGGSVDGGKVLGNYPDDLSDNGPLNLGRGRLVPTTSWEAVWNAIAQWFGVPEEDLETILPNLVNFPADQIFDLEDLFEVAEQR